MSTRQLSDAVKKLPHDFQRQLLKDYDPANPSSSAFLAALDQVTVQDLQELIDYAQKEKVG